MKISFVLLAAGNSSRFPTNKLLYQLQGKAIIQYAFEKGLQIPFYKRVVVTQYEQVENLAKQYGYYVVSNPRPEKGIAYSMKLGLQVCMDSDYVMFLVSDQPYLSLSTLQQMIRMCDGKHMICASYQQKMRNPVLFPKYFFEELCTIEGDKGGSQLLKKYPHMVKKVDCESWEVKDIDTIEDVI